MGIAGVIGVVLASSIIQFAQVNNYTSGLIYLLAAMAGLITFALSFVTGISPTAILYLNTKEAQFQSTGNVIPEMKLLPDGTMVMIYEFLDNPEFTAKL